jgi:MinD superfamily P-loop ATPase
MMSDPKEKRPLSTQISNQAPPFVLAVASGKGGTGKTTLSVNLARVMDRPVMLLDCDVEEPNVHLFLKGDLREEHVVFLPVPEVDESRCNACGECGRFCEFHAIVSLKTTPLVFPELCHGCGGCTLVCPEKAIHEKDYRIGAIQSAQAGKIIRVQGLLDVGSPMAAPLIRAVKAGIQGGMPAILDAPPGTSCPVIAAIRDSDFVILVTEPTPFGLHDLTLAVDMVKTLGIPFGVVINRMGAGDQRVHRFCEDLSIRILAEIPDDRQIAETYSRGEVIVDSLPEYREIFTRLLKTVSERISAENIGKKE